MSLEIALAENTAALKAVALLLEKGNAGRAEALAAAGNLAAPTAGAKRGPKPKDAAATTATTTAKVGPPTVEDIRTAFGGYMGVTDETEREKRKANVKAILAEIGVGKATEISEEDRAKAIGWVNDFAAGRKVNFSADGDGAEGDDLL